MKIRILQYLLAYTIYAIERSAEINEHYATKEVAAYNYAIAREKKHRRNYKVPHDAHSISFRCLASKGYIISTPKHRLVKPDLKPRDYAQYLG